MLSQRLGMQFISPLSTQHEEIYNTAMIIISLYNPMIKLHILKFFS